MMMMLKISSISSVSAVSSSSIKIPVFPRRDFTLSTSLSPTLTGANRNSRQNSLLVSASGRNGAKTEKNKKKRGGVEFSDEDGEWEEEEEEEGWDDEEGDEEGMTPFDRMRKWMRNKPTGFGEGKSYDVSLEEKLMEEIEQSRKAQLANINKLKNSDSGSGSGRAKPVAQKLQTKEAVIPPSGVRVRVGNLPKKKNIHRDLQTAFGGFPGIINITPAVTGNKKTRDPVCRGFAFLDFKTEVAANRFIKAYSKQSLSFGKVEKQVTCHVMTPNEEGKYVSDKSATLASQEEISERYNEREVMEPTNPENLIISSSQVKHPEIRAENSQIILANFEGSNHRSNDGKLGIDTSSSIDVQKRKAPVSKQKTKKKTPQKASKVKVPGSASRLRIKERDVLTDVFSKYGGKAAMLAK